MAVWRLARTGITCGNKGLASWISRDERSCGRGRDSLLLVCSVPQPFHPREARRAGVGDSMTFRSRLCASPRATLCVRFALPSLQGSGVNEFLRDMQRYFTKVARMRVDASRWGGRAYGVWKRSLGWRGGCEQVCACLVWGWTQVGASGGGQRAA